MFQIWRYPNGNYALLEDLTQNDQRALLGAGFSLERELEANDNHAAQQQFIDWVRTYRDPSVRVEPVDKETLCRKSLSMARQSRRATRKP